MTDDDKALLIAKHFCQHSRADLMMPCGSCMNAGRACIEKLNAVPADDVALFDPDANTPGQATRHHPDTAQAARWAVMPKTGSQRRRVLDALSSLHATGRGMTDEGLARHLGLPLNTIRPRRYELVRGGWVKDSGARSMTENGAEAIVWRLSLEGAIRLHNEGRPR